MSSAPDGREGECSPRRAAARLPDAAVPVEHVLPGAGAPVARVLSGAAPAARVVATAAPVALALANVPAASAHEANAGSLTQGHGAVVLLVGVALVVGAALGKRRGRLAPTPALHLVLGGIAVAVVGAVLFDGLAPDPTYGASTLPFPRTWYPFVALTVGLVVVLASVVLGWARWPDRPRYAALGMVAGLWIAYPALVPGAASDTHPVGYALVLGTPVLVGYVLWTDAREPLRAALRDPVARRFGAGVGSLVGLFYLSTSGYLTVFWEEGGPTEPTVAVLPASYQLVRWPTLEVALPDVPLFAAMSVGVAAVVGLLSALVGLNAALVAGHWRAESGGGFAEGTAGTGAVVGACTCGCCGPLVAKAAVLAAGPSVAAPLYWVFVDTASPLSTLFIVGSVVLFTATLLYSVESARRPDRSPVAPATD